MAKYSFYNLLHVKIKEPPAKDRAAFLGGLSRRVHAMQALNNRLEYLTDKRDNFGASNTYDVAEIRGLKWALSLIEHEKDAYVRAYDDAKLVSSDSHSVSSSDEVSSAGDSSVS